MRSFQIFLVFVVAMICGYVYLLNSDATTLDVIFYGVFITFATMISVFIFLGFCLTKATEEVATVFVQMPAEEKARTIEMVLRIGRVGCKTLSAGKEDRCQAFFNAAINEIH